MSLSEEPIIPTDPPPPAHDDSSCAQRVRRRRVTRRQMIPTDPEGQAEFIASLARRAYPSFELFVFSLLCGAIMGLGFFLDSQAVLLLGVLLTPLMTPWVGSLLAVLTGSLRFFFETMMALFISATLVLIGGLLTGFGARLFMPITLTNVFNHAHLWPEELFVIGIGAITLIASFLRSEEKPYLPSIIIAYAFYLPINAAGFGLGAGLQDVFLPGLLVFLVHLALTSVLGLLTFFVLKVRPSASGLAFSGVILLIYGTIMIIYMRPSPAPVTEAVITSTPTTQPTALPTLTPSLIPTTKTIRPSSTAAILSSTPATEIAEGTTTITSTPVTSTAVPLTLAITLPASETPTVTMTIDVQPIFGKVGANEGGGANLRQTPNGKYLMTLDNGTIVEIYPDFKQVNGVTWIHVFVTRNGQRVEGWLLESVVTYATPEPNFEPSSTPTFGITPAP